MKTLLELWQEWQELAEIATANPADEAAQDAALDAFTRYLDAGLQNVLTFAEGGNLHESLR